MKTVIFDVDDTLYDQLLPFTHAVKEQIDHDFTNSEIISLYVASRKYSDEVFEKHMSGEISALELQTYRIRKACEEFGLTISYEDAELFQDSYLRYQQQITLFPEIEKLLIKLSNEKRQIAILTNGVHDHQMMKVKQLQLERWVPENHIFVSGAIGHSKPSQKVFQHIENALQLVKDETVYIGDSYENDIAGAKQAGWKAVWFNHRRRKIKEPEWQADYTVDTPADLLPIFT
ncbi:putative hydrolase of the HAD superfamily [Gracilibacillus ureilyticus]|uniref:Putative hydrolase of the HAD superfamily n=1 Tax=Gracilibacillus ureilyticus TaxID=531814 RepID=A0A1H9MSM3_9BACI|nr:HAD family hydrolase [Gracilibacillus ureilyticus]SER26682.1 putative hydrolase of the HAD superfamily [Gracilibacillus ureilyticus]